MHACMHLAYIHITYIRPHVRTKVAPYHAAAAERGLPCGLQDVPVGSWQPYPGNASAWGGADWALGEHPPVRCAGLALSGTGPKRDRP